MQNVYSNMFTLQSRNAAPWAKDSGVGPREDGLLVEKFYIEVLKGLAWAGLFKTAGSPGSS